MKNFLYYLLLSFFLFNCQSTPKDVVFEHFEKELFKNGIQIDSVDALQMIYISKGDLSLHINLENVRKDYEKDPDLKYVDALVENIINYKEKLTIWDEAKSKVYTSVFPSDFAFEDILHHKLSDNVEEVYVLKEEDQLSYINQENLKNWGISEKDLMKEIASNIDELMKQSTISVDTLEGHSLITIETISPALKSSILFSDAFKKYMKKHHSLPFYAVLPNRDYCYIFSKKDRDYFLQRIGDIVIEEYKNSSYPITSEVIEINRKGVKIHGEFPVE